MEVADIGLYKWERFPNIPTPRCFSTATQFEGKVYVFGGCDPQGAAIDIAEVYDLATKTWSLLPSMPTKRAAASKVAVVRKRLVVIGGVDPKQAPLAAVDAFDPYQQKWERLPPLPIGVVGPCVQVVEEKIYVLGGTDKKGCNQSVVFDFDSNEWRHLPPKPTPSYSSGAYHHGNKIYVVGGRGGANAQEPIKACDAFDLEVQQWEELAPMATVRVFYNFVGYGDFFYVIGGLVPMVGVCKIVERYSIKENKWLRIQDLIMPRSDCVCALIGNRIVIAGGLGGELPNIGSLAHAEAMNPRDKRKTWVEIPSMSKPRTSMCYFSFDDKLFTISGAGEGGAQQLVEVLSVEKAESKEP
ncbi:hypothetical protein EMCRGX_G000380 [Ephydatia muelleri]